MMRNLPFIIIIVAVAAVGGWWYYSSQSAATVQITPAGVGGPTLELVNRVKRIHIDTAFFQDPGFLALSENPPLDVSGFAKGRPNPFLSLRKTGIK
jgi:hypothetical protein